MAPARSLWAAAAAVALLAAPAAEAAPKLAVSAAWSRPAAAGMNGAGFLTVTNSGDRADALVGAESAVAGKVEMHQTMMHDGVMMMHPLPRLAVPARGSARLAPGGTHLMLIGLKRPLKVGDTAPVTLVFASGTRLEAVMSVAIQAP